MTATNVRVQMQQRRDTASGWTSANPTLLSGELGYETDTGKWKIGTGSAAWSSLAYTNWSQISYPIATADIADDAVTGAKLANNIDIAGTLDVTSAATFDNNVTVQGNLTVNGTTTTIDTTTLLVKDKNIELGVLTSSETNPPPSDFSADGGGITLKGTTDKTITWINATDAWTLSEHLNIASAKEFRIAGTKVLDATSLGSAVVGSSLTSVGTIATGVWNGTAIASAYITDSAITSAKIADGAIINADINASAAIADTKLGTISTAAKVSNSATTATNANTASAIVARDGSGNFAAGTVTAALTGNAATSTALSSARNFAVTGDITGTVSSDLTSGASIATAIAAGAIVNADINASAAIAGTKVSPDFGSQAITTTGIINANGKVSFPLGSESAPSLLPGSDTNTGIFSPGADQLAITTAGTQRVTVDSLGKVGIGTATPDFGLHLHRSSSYLKISNSGTGEGGSDGLLVGIDGTGNCDIWNYENKFTRFATNNTERMRIDSSGKVGIGYSSPPAALSVHATGTDSTTGFFKSGVSNVYLQLGNSLNDQGYLGYESSDMTFVTAGSERMRINSSGHILFGTTTNGSTAVGTVIRSTGETLMTRNDGNSLLINRRNTDGILIDFRQDNTSEGSINVSGSTVSLVGGHLARWSQLPGGIERTEILRGSVLSNLDEMCEWGEEDNEQLNRMKVSDVEGDKNVSGVFQSWDDDDDTYVNDFYCAMTGDFVIRIAQGTTVARGDLLMSAGDGTAKPQDDDIVRSKTIAKVTSTSVSETYADGSYCVPCVLMAC